MSQAIQKRIAYIGAGQMCEAIFSGLISSGSILPEHILLYDVNESRLTDLQIRYRTNILTPSAHAYEDLVSWADIVFLSVRPQDARETLSKALPAGSDCNLNHGRGEALLSGGIYQKRGSGTGNAQYTYAGNGRSRRNCPGRPLYFPNRRVGNLNF